MALIIHELIGFVTNLEELYSTSILIHVQSTLHKCIDYCIKNSKEPLTLLEIEAVIDFLQDELNTGHWSEVPLSLRHSFTIASFVKCLTIIKNSQQTTKELLTSCIKCIDLGLLLGAPLKLNESLLTDSAKYLTEKLNCHNLNTVELEISQVDIKEKILYYESLSCKEIDCLAKPSLEHFNNNYFLKQLPVKLADCINHWPAKTKWHDVNYLLKIAGERTVPIELGSQYSNEDWTQKLMTLKDFILQHYLEDNPKIGYLAQHNLFDQIPELREDIRIPEYCCLSLDYDSIEDADINAWFGPAGTVSPLHHDPKNNFLTQVYGTKQIILFAPDDSNFLYPHEGEMLTNTSQVNPLMPDFEQFPEFSKAKMFKCLLRPGEMLFIPVKWWHHVSALEKSFSVSFWWK